MNKSKLLPKYTLIVTLLLIGLATASIWVRANNDSASAKIDSSDVITANTPTQLPKLNERTAPTLLPVAVEPTIISNTIPEPPAAPKADPVATTTATPPATNNQPTAASFRINNGSTRGWPIATNVSLDLSISFDAGYDNGLPVTIDFSGPAGFSCPSITVLPFKTEQIAYFTCDLPDNRNNGHNIINMYASNGNQSSTATFDLEIVHP
jgi:hypothetical protein